MKKLLLLGVGAQGSTVAKRMNEESNVSEIICADYDAAAVDEMERTLEKATARQLDATRVENIVEAARGGGFDGQCPAHCAGPQRVGSRPGS